MQKGIRIGMGLMVAALAGQMAMAQIARTAFGQVEGVKAADAAVTVFKGIPYAAAPVGELRWKAPEPPAKWSGVRKTDAFSAACMQRITPGPFGPWTQEFLTANKVSEDCLYLNVWTPSVSAAAGVPVIVFIHGGGFTSGSGDVPIYDATNLAATGVVVVSFNYRLGVFGFLAHPELTAESEHRSSGNYGLLDQVAALKWVKENVKAFGGDPKRVTIWGQSAGAMSVGSLLASPLAAGLFERAMADSALTVAAVPLSDLKAAEKTGSDFATAHKAATIKDLRATKAEDLLPAPGQFGMQFSPIVDGWLLPDTPLNMSMKGTDNDVPVITGYQKDDSFTYFAPTTTVDAYDKMAERQCGGMAAEFKKLYPATNDDEVKAMVEESNRDRNRVGMYLWAVGRTKSHKQPVRTYFFTRAIPWPQHPEFKVFHTGEVPYFLLNLKMLDRPWEPADFKVADTAASYLRNFAGKGDPNGAGVPEWAAVAEGKPETMEIGVRMGPMPLAEKERMEFWVRYFNSPEGKKAPFL